MNVAMIRQKFLQFFKTNGHEMVASSPVIPAEDPTLLFANAGMNQFKDCFLGKEKRSYVRATSSQKCVRAGGKHNDLENVGFTARHLTFFEMLGNFSFGDYFKKEAIDFAWRFLTQEIGIAPEKLYVTVFEKDDEAYELWHQVTGIPYERISRLGEADNFWAMGETGPCGPCTEIYFDRGEAFGTGPENQAPGGSGDRFIEIWNLVFMQYNRQSDGQLIPLKQTGVDTGMGLERLAAVLQGKKTVFQTDLFEDIKNKITQLTGVVYQSASAQQQAAFHVLSDHIRSTSFIIADGAAPSNEGRGYVLRKIIRRAALFAQKLSDKPFFHELVEALAETMGTVYPELVINKTLIKSVLAAEVDKFSSSLLVGKNMFDRYADQMKKDQKNLLDGALAFKLYDTYGFPLELTKVMAHERGLTVDEKGFALEMEKQQLNSGKKEQTSGQLNLPENTETLFVGYESLSNKSTLLFAEAADEQRVWLVTAETPFYVESGGQVNDQGFVVLGQKQAKVLDLKKISTGHNKQAIAVLCQLPDAVSFDEVKKAIGSSVESVVLTEARMSTVKNHTATHMLQAALVQVLGPQVKQAGSVVEPDYLRFDFAHQKPMTDQEIAEVEQLINQKIQEDIKTEIVTTTLAKAKEAGATAFFGEKYNPENVRVVSVPGFSVELCGGTHAPRTGIIGAFKIISEVSLATGTRRIVAVTGPAAIALFQEVFVVAQALSEQFKVKIPLIVESVQKQNQELQNALSEIRQLKKKVLVASLPEWLEKVETINQLSFLSIELQNASADEMKMILQECEKKYTGLLAITNQVGERLSYLLSLRPSVHSHCSLVELHQAIQKELGVKGGGSAALVQGSGVLEAKLLIDAVKRLIAK